MLIWHITGTLSGTIPAMASRTLSLEIMTFSK